MRLEGKVALVTGAATGIRGEVQGIGGATAWLFAREGAKVVVADINDDLGIPAKLGDVGVKKTHIRPMAKAAMLSGNIAVNPRKTSQRDLETIFHKAI